MAKPLIDQNLAGLDIRLRELDPGFLQRDLYDSFLTNELPLTLGDRVSRPKDFPQHRSKYLASWILD
jgi:hypothetical protein